MRGEIKARIKVGQGPGEPSNADTSEQRTDTLSAQSPENLPGASVKTVFLSDNVGYGMSCKNN